MKADIKAMKEQMSTMMEAMMSMRRMMEVNAAIVVAASTATKVDPTHSFDFWFWIWIIFSSPTYQSLKPLLLASIFIFLI